MSIGIRILSENLSGQSSNVVYYPTSGGTIDLGTQVIPFDYLNPYYYGTYELYVPTYGYTYELIIDEPNNVESAIMISKMMSNNNYGSANSNFGDFTTEIIDLGNDFTDWSLEEILPLTNSGYAYYFINRNTCNLSWFLFTDSTGNIIGQYQEDTNCDYTYGNLSGKWVYFVDNYNGVATYSNGQEVHTINVDPSYQQIYFNIAWNGVMSSDSFSIKINDLTGNTSIDYIINNNVMIKIGESYNTTNYDRYVLTYFSGSFAPIIQHNNQTSNFDNIEFYNSDGTLLQNISLSGETYDDWDFQFYGDNKCIIIFWSNIDINVDYLIIHYNGYSDVISTMTHSRGSNYEFSFLNSDTRFDPNNGGNESFVINFYHESSNNHIGSIVTYCDLIYMLSGDTNFRTYTFQDSGVADKTIKISFSISNHLNTLCDNGDGILSTLSLVQSGVTFNTTNIPMSGNPSSWYSLTIRNGTVEVITTWGVGTGCTLVHIVEDGVLADLVSNIPFPGGSNQFRIDTIANLFQCLDYFGNSYHLDDTSNLFQYGGALTGNTIYTHYSSPQFKYDFLTVGPILTYNYNTRETNILTSTGYSDTFTLPENNGFWVIDVGNDKFLYSFIDLNGFVNINLYDFNFNLLNSLVTEHTSYYTSFCSGNRYVMITDDSFEYNNYLVSESTIISSTLSGNNNHQSLNDYIWWSS